MRTSTVIGAIACLAVAGGGVAKAAEGDVPFGLLLIGFACSLFGNIYYATRKTHD